MSARRCPECGTALPSPGDVIVVCSECHRATFLSREGRDPSTPLPFVDAGCRDLTASSAVSAVSSSERGKDVASEAIDGHRGSLWHSGARPPGWWCVDLGDVHQVRGVTLVPAMQPAKGAVRHVIETCVGGEDWAERVVLAQQMTDAAVYTVDFGAPVEARWVRIRTDESVSQVGWYEIGIFG